MRAYRVYLGDVLWCLLLAGLALLVRWPALGLEAFHNQDTAGIAYNADLLLRGGLPLVDNVEMKAPGSFYLSAMAWSLFGRSLTVLQAVACGWAILAAIGIYVGGHLLYDRRAGLIASALYTIAAPITDSIDINYGAWMMAPYIWSTVFFIRGQDRRGGWWLVASGATLAIAGLLKRQAAVLFPLLAVLLLVAPLLDCNERWRAHGRPWRKLLWFLGGLALGFAPLLAYYAYRGHLGAFISHYFFSEVGWQYVKGALTWGERLSRVGDGFLGFWEYMALPTLLAVLSVAAGGFHRRWTARGVLLGGHFWMSFVGAALGLRFFKGYYLQILPAAVWIAAHPDGVLHRWLYRRNWRGRRVVGRNLAALALLLLALSPALLSHQSQLSRIRTMRSKARDTKAQKVAAVIGRSSQAGDEIWVWGRWAWPIYFHADRPAATAYPKTLGLFTTTLTNTWRRPTKNTAFDPQSDWKTLMSQLKRDRPVFIVLSHNEKYRKFTALNALLTAEYRAVRGPWKRRFSVYRRRDVPAPSRPRLTPPPRQRAKGETLKTRDAEPGAGPPTKGETPTEASDPKAPPEPAVSPAQPSPSTPSPSEGK